MTNTVPRRALTMADVRERHAELIAVGRRHGVDHIRVFGSVVRGDADHVSDLDLLVDVQPGYGLLALSAFALDVEGLLHVPTQVTTPKGLKPRIRDRVLAEAVEL